MAVGLDKFSSARTETLKQKIENKAKVRYLGNATIPLLFSKIERMPIMESDFLLSKPTKSYDFKLSSELINSHY